MTNAKIETKEIDIQIHDKILIKKEPYNKFEPIYDGNRHDRHNSWNKK